MSLVETSQILVVLLFLGALFAIQAIIRRKRGEIRSRLGREGRLQMLETMALGQGERVVLLSVDGAPYLLHSKKSGGTLMAVPARDEAAS